MVIDYFRMKFGAEGEFTSGTPAINRALQVLGRVLRAPEDRGCSSGGAAFPEPGPCRAAAVDAGGDDALHHQSFQKEVAMAP